MGKLLIAAACAALAWTAAAAAADPAPTPPPARVAAEAFGALPFLSGPEVSPDGRHLVASSVIDGKKAVILADLDAADYGLQKIALPENVDVIWARWAGPAKILLSLLVPGEVYGVQFKSSR